MLKMLVVLISSCIVITIQFASATTCTSSSGVASQVPDKDYPRDCADVISIDGCAPSGIYPIYPDGFTTLGFDAYCDMDTDGGGWTVIQRRECGCIDFYLDWDDYKNGFGCLNSEHWLGNDHIHSLTNHTDRGMTLRVDLTDWSCPAVSRFAQYDTFSIEAEAEKYSIQLTTYSGNAGDALTYHNGGKFSTKDQDNDLYDPTSCAEAYKGAWWYKGCHDSNLNGLYREGGNTSEHGTIIVWQMWKGDYYSMKNSAMKVRPKAYWATENQPDNSE